jgi:hypothetical protein
VQTVDLTSSPAATATAAVATAPPIAPPPDAADFFSWPLLIGVGGVAATVSYVRPRRREEREEAPGGDR